MSSSAHASAVALDQEPQEPGRVLLVPDQYEEIGAALASADKGDTVRVGAGTYQERLVVPPGVKLIGEGWEQTFIDGQNNGVVVFASPGAYLEGVTILNGGPDYYDAGVQVNQGDVTLKEVRLTANSAGLWAICFNPQECDLQVTVENSLVDENRFTGINSNEFPVLFLYNNTVVRNDGPAVVLNHPDSQAENNLIAFNSNDGLVNNVGAATRYNDVWGNGRDYTGDPGEGNLSADPLLRDPDGGDYRLRAGSPAVGAGSSQGTDLGALPFTPTGEAPTGLALSLSSCSEWQVSWDISQEAAGYILYHGPASRQTTTVRDLGPATSINLEEMSEAAAGYLAVSWYDSAGLESQAAVYSGQPNPCPSAPADLEAGAFPGGQVRLQWLDDSQVENAYWIERSLGSLAPAEFTLVATLPADTRVYTDVPPLEEETYWYRVQAANTSGSSTHTDTSYSATFRQSPSQDERYLLALINEARSDPAAFGSPSVAPLPPLAYQPLLGYAARAQSQAILNAGFAFAQTDLIGRSPTDRARAVGYDGEEVTEILVQSLDGPDWVEASRDAFLRSESNRNILLCPCFNQAGPGHAFDLQKGGESTARGQWAVDLSNIETAELPRLPAGIAVPYAGSDQTAFTFIANYYDSGGTAPQEALVVIDGQPHEMALSTGSPANGTYRYSATLPFGGHEYYFTFTSPTGQARLPETGSYSGPVIHGVFLPLLTVGN